MTRYSDASANEQSVILGTWQQIPLPMISRYLGESGWPWVILDAQHYAFDPQTAYECIHVLRAAGSLPLVRVSVGDLSEIGRVLDWGAAGVVVPMVNSIEEAQQAADAAKYPPLGNRSVGGEAVVQAGLDRIGDADAETWLLVQMEHIDSASQIESIMAVEGVDGCFIGPVDLAMSMGLPLNSYEQNERFQEAITRTIEACRATGKLSCCNTYSWDDAQNKSDLGFGCLTMGSDVDLFTSSSRQQLRRLQSISRTVPGPDTVTPLSKG